MKNIVIIEKNGDCKNVNIKNVNLIDISKKCGFRKLDHFEKRVSWKINYKSSSLIVAVYAKNNGRANSENKFDMPPPIDNELYFGTIAIIAYKNKLQDSNCIDFNVDDWCKVYEKLMGGFIDLSKESEIESEEDIPEEELSKEGYHKDGFIVDSEEEVEEGNIENNKEENEEESTGEYSEEESYSEYSEYSEGGETETETEVENKEIEEDNIGSELSEEEYLTE